jgi:hypothetical protein
VEALHGAARGRGDESFFEAGGVGHAIAPGQWYRFDDGGGDGVACVRLRS